MYFYRVRKKQSWRIQGLGVGAKVERKAVKNDCRGLHALARLLLGITLWFRVYGRYGSGSRVMDQITGSRVWGLGCRVDGLGHKVSGSGRGIRRL